MLCVQRYRLRMPASAVLFVAALAVNERQCPGQSGDNGTVTKSEVQQVFPPPSREELSKLERPELRLELLRMASEDQAGRLAGG